MMASVVVGTGVDALVEEDAFFSSVFALLDLAIGMAVVDAAALGAPKNDVKDAC